MNNKEKYQHLLAYLADVAFYHLASVRLSVVSDLHKDRAKICGAFGVGLCMHGLHSS
jgi:hypothetical protein